MVSPAYDYFMTKLEDITERSEPVINVQKIPTHFPQYFVYDRVKQLVRIKTTTKYAFTNYMNYEVESVPQDNIFELNIFP